MWGKPPCRWYLKILLQECCKACCKSCSRIAARLLQECCKSAWFKACCKVAARLPARPRHCFKISAVRLLQGCCKNAAMFASRLVVRVLQGLPQDCCKSAPRLLQDLLGSFWNFPLAPGSLLYIKFYCIVLSVLFLLRFGRPPGTLFFRYFG